jgi:CIC family chloride channel protein
MATATNDPIPTSSRWQRLRPSEDKLFLVLALATGALAGFAAVCYHLFIVMLFRWVFAGDPSHVARWRWVASPAIGGLLGGFILLRWRQARGSGINQLRTSLLVHDGHVSLRGTIGKFLASGIGIGLGLPLGPEDPALHIGGGLASALGRWFALSKKRRQQMVSVGAAAGLAAAFNTPITAVIFVLEEIVGDINAPLLGPAILASVTAVIVERAMLGGEPLFRVPNYQLGRVSELIFYAVLGLLGGIFSAAFTSSVVYLRGWLGRLKRRGPFDWVSTTGGLLAGALALVIPGILGVGYSHVNDALDGTLVLKVLVLLFVCKMLATTVAFASGNSGGLFAPSLFFGAMLGGVVGTVARGYFGNVISSPGPYALVGMGAMFAGIIRAPITSIFMIFEVTQDYQIMLPVMIANIIAFAVARALHPHPMFESLAMQDGVHLPTKEDRYMAMLTVSDAMRAGQRFEPEVPAERAAELLRLGDEDAGMVLRDGRLAGLITADLLARAPMLATVGEIAVDPARYSIFPDEGLAAALARLGGGASLLPVVSRIDPSQLLGVVGVRDVLRAYGLAQDRPAKKHVLVQPEARES